MELHVFIEPQQGTNYAAVVELARAAERCGFAGFFTSDHYLRMGEGSPEPGPLDAWTTLAGLARDTERLRLGTLVSPVTFRHPGPLAVAVAQVDDMSGGRVELGLGAGWFAQEHLAHAIAFPDQGERFARLSETLEILTGHWAAAPDRRFSYDGRHYTVVESPGLPKPRQSPHPPIIIGGWGTRTTPRLAARFATEFNVPFPSPDGWREACGRVRDACDALGRDPEDLRYTAAQVVCCGADRAEFLRRAAAIGREPDELAANGACGLVADVRERLARFAELGAERVYLQVLDIDDVDHLELIASEVMPAVR